MGNIKLYTLWSKLVLDTPEVRRLKCSAVPIGSVRGVF